MIQSTAVYEGFLVLRWFLDAVVKDHIFELAFFSYLRTSLLHTETYIFLPLPELITSYSVTYCLPEISGLEIIKSLFLDLV